MASTMREHHTQVNRAINRFRSTLAAAKQKAANARVGVTSPDKTVRVEVGGDLRVREVSIRPGALRTCGPTQLGQSIVDAYNQAVTTVQRAQWKVVVDAFKPSGEGK
ncbi:YbaB/EbfC family nucleoid-associated protein [Phytomonospora endophytica]|uniref:DNA-binding protein YbaB n=1 Tax=Phytomonospora endophytica TaxID=714109 RepID=A0A841F7D3_9ACTN|nr:YbaB/EbfC family nucleoid-associated protein [Phytomonospora endophytica]MBB6032931.1 DNA-binding protein YbaB [Phytomonospora endophytica]GIG65157.1 hypothetical protein Pen01_14520 [Phytomonospora endophytica]